MTDFVRLNALALSQAPALLKRWLPAGKVRGAEFVCGSLAGDPGDSLSVNLRSGLWSDFATGESGRDLIALAAAKFHAGDQGAAARALAKELGVPVNGAAAPASARPKDDWLPIVPPPADAPEPAQDDLRCDALHTYRDADGRTLFFVLRFEARDGRRKRFCPLTFGALNGQRGWHRRQPGSPRPLYGLDALAKLPNAPVLLCEGEKSANAAQWLFPNRVCMTWPGGSSAVAHADWSPLRDRDLVFWPDNDGPGRAAAAEIAKILPQARIIRVDDLAPGADAADIEPDDPEAWLADRLPAPPKPEPTEPDWSEWDQAPLPGEPSEGAPPIAITWFDDIEPCLDTLDFVQGVLVERGAVVIYGPSGAGKTFLVVDLALSVAAGKSWHGRRVEQGGVIYCCLEGNALFQNRIAAWRQNHGLTGIPFGAVQSSLNLLDPSADTPRLIEAIKAAATRIGMPIKLIVVDTLSRALFGGDENASEDMGALVINMDAIRAATGACVAFVHHSGKDQAKGARGHSLLRASLDTEVEVAGQAGEERKTATVVKQRDMKNGDAFAFRLTQVALGVNRYGEPVTSCVAEPEDGQSIKQAGFLGKISPTARQYHKALLDAIVAAPAPGRPETTTMEAWRTECVRCGLLDNPKDATTPRERDNIKSLLRKYRTELKAAGWIGIDGDHVTNLCRTEKP